MVTEAVSLLGRAGASPRGQVAVSRLVLAEGFPLDRAAVGQRDRAVAYPQVLGVVSPRVLAGASRLDQAVVYLLAPEAVSLQDQGVAARLVHVVDCPPDHARGLTQSGTEQAARSKSNDTTAIDHALFAE